MTDVVERRAAEARLIAAREELRAAEARLIAAREELRAAEEAYHEAIYVDLHEAHRRWGTGYKIVFDAEQRPTSFVDGFGREVPHEDWDEFTAYLEAMARAKFQVTPL